MSTDVEFIERGKVILKVVNAVFIPRIGELVSSHGALFRVTAVVHYQDKVVRVTLQETRDISPQFDDI